MVGEEIATLGARVKGTRVEAPIPIAYLTHLGWSYDNPVSTHWINH